MPRDKRTASLRSPIAVPAGGHHPPLVWSHRELLRGHPACTTAHAARGGARLLLLLQLLLLQLLLLL